MKNTSALQCHLMGLSLGLCVLSSLALAQETKSPTSNSEMVPKKSSGSFVEIRRSLPEVLSRDKVRVFYATTGPHAIDGTDINRNSIPDQVEDVAIQAWAARALWISLGFPDPLASDRFTGVTWIDVHLLNRDTLKANGLTYDEIQRFGRPGDPVGTQSLCFDVATSVKPSSNLTPAHEMFHVIQNGTNYFKNRWFTEGTARWSEKGLGAGASPKGELSRNWPPDDEGMKQIFSSTYDAVSGYWTPLLLQHSRVVRIPREKLPAELLQAQYINGKQVLEDFDLLGWDLMRDILAALGNADDLVFQERGLSRWSEAEQRSELNNAIIHDVVEQIATGSTKK